MKTFAALIFVLLAASASAAPRVDFGRAMAEADKAREGAEGRNYAGALAAAMTDIYSTGIHCVPIPPTRDSYFTIVFSSQLMEASNESLNGRRVRQRDALLGLEGQEVSSSSSHTLASFLRDWIRRYQNELAI